MRHSLIRLFLAAGLSFLPAAAHTQGPPPHAWLFGEDQARYLIETSDAEAMVRAALAAGVPARRIGRVDGQGGGAALTLPGAGAISIAELRAAHEAWLPGYMSEG